MRSLSSERYLLDGPTSGLDPAATADFNALLSQVRDHGTAVLMVTHELLSAADVVLTGSFSWKMGA